MMNTAHYAFPTISNSDLENYKNYFLQLVKENKVLLENEKEYCRAKYVHYFELTNALDKYGEPRECNNCETTRYSDKYCEKCISLHLQSLFRTWTSGNEIIDSFIQKCQQLSSLPKHIIEWIPYEQFYGIEKLTEGGFSSIYTAWWTRGAIDDYDENEKVFSYFGDQGIVLKSLNNSSNLGKSFFDEALNYCKIKSSLVVPCFGITKFPENGNYAIVLNYLKEGNLRDYIQKNHYNLTSKDRINLFVYLCEALYRIHSKDLIHCDLHSGNILLQGGGCYITDFGLCGPVDDKLSNKIYGIVSYIAPELLGGKSNTRHTKETDVYSVGMLMWEIFAGHPPFDDRAHDVHLQLKICEGLRPPILPGMPDDCARIMQRCWDVDPAKRPTIGELCGFSDNQLKEIINNDNDISSISSNNSQQIHRSHPLAYHTSRILNDVNDEFAKSNLKSNDSLLSDLDINEI